MAQWNIEKKTITVGGRPVVVRAMTARERQAIASRCRDGQEMSTEAVLLCSQVPDDETHKDVAFFADLADVLDAPCGYIAQIGDEILRLSGIATEGGENPT